MSLFFKEISNIIQFVPFYLIINIFWKQNKIKQKKIISYIFTKFVPEEVKSM